MCLHQRPWQCGRRDSARGRSIERAPSHLRGLSGGDKLIPFHDNAVRTEGEPVRTTCVMLASIHGEMPARRASGGVSHKLDELLCSACTGKAFSTCYHFILGYLRGGAQEFVGAQVKNCVSSTTSHTWLRSKHGLSVRQQTLFFILFRAGLDTVEVASLRPVQKGDSRTRVSYLTAGSREEDMPDFFGR